ncbi:Protein N-acetyltransferase, RimJ/RimL family [Nonomuraea maritima]|uniref:Protein N-acetyltransferase, RimJ/RimL family n=1 Tax=Nonomuraea maritima TaxID=683260 RepID=A0A1G9EQA8_9ACTN|nr:GNAT family N-acetyltransferase [Nonomuraea maritima]SDK78310.1 Protein N-acetyltransferase, RimJ/RimL family [Nonomuraea maritima]
MLKPDYPITTPRLALRPFTHADLDALHAYYSDPDVVRYLYWEACDRDATRTILDNKINRTAIHDEGDAIDLAITLRDTGELIGNCLLIWTSKQHRQGEIGYVLNPAHHGHGYATEAARPLLELGFNGLGLHRIAGRLDARNTASARVLEKLHMRREATLIDNEYVKGEWTSETIYAILATEWTP